MVYRMKSAALCEGYDSLSANGIMGKEGYGVGVRGREDLGQEGKKAVAKHGRTRQWKAEL